MAIKNIVTNGLLGTGSKWLITRGLSVAAATLYTFLYISNAIIQRPEGIGEIQKPHTEGEYIET